MIRNYFNPYFLFLVFIILLAMIIKSSLISALAIFYTGVFPFICIVRWISKSGIGGEIINKSKKWHIAVYISWFIFLYSIYAQKWAAETINQIFPIDATKLSITYKLLAFLFTPFGIFYQQSVLSGFWDFLIVIVTLLSVFIPVLLIINVSFKKVAKITVISFVFMVSSTFFISVISKISFNKNELITNFALWADFSNYHLCTGDWVSNTDSVLFLDGGYVLAYHQRNSKDTRFTVERCNYKRKL
ncbi:hypothetical protein NGC36_23020 [Serratia rubidaea]|uniref:Uncharacterized protein n=1 Tax=Serratia rubidaea TaxID=61652 RepID=A0ABS0MFD7_SERRU|nr:hypothetical protein [Serratia rubidaea]MBH1931080.1 hypothetical protein [Serratia rubidaea]MEB7588143.1 hypothetical protein [Serratia rubidaea]